MLDLSIPESQVGVQKGLRWERGETEGKASEGAGEEMDRKREGLGRRNRVCHSGARGPHTAFLSLNSVNSPLFNGSIDFLFYNVAVGVDLVKWSRGRIVVTFRTIFAVFAFAWYQEHSWPSAWRLDASSRLSISVH